MHLVDTDGKGVERITETGVVVAGVEYPVDCIIYASGFEVGTEPTRRAGFDLTGRDGVRLSEHWSGGMRTHARHPRARLPERVLRAADQGGNLISNVPHNLTDAARTIAAVVAHMRAAGSTRGRGQPQEAEDAWMELLRTGSGCMSSFLAAARPATTTTRARALARTQLLAGYQAGAPAYFRYIGQWRDSGRFEGLEFSRRA